MRYTTSAASTSFTSSYDNAELHQRMSSAQRLSKLPSAVEPGSTSTTNHISTLPMSSNTTGKMCSSARDNQNQIIKLARITAIVSDSDGSQTTTNGKKGNVSLTHTELIGDDRYEHLSVIMYLHIVADVAVGNQHGHLLAIHKHPALLSGYCHRAHNAVEEQARFQSLCTNTNYRSSHSYEPLKQGTTRKTTRTRPGRTPSNSKQHPLRIPCACHLAHDVPPTCNPVKRWPRATNPSAHVSYHMHWANRLCTGGVGSRCRNLSQISTNIHFFIAQLEWGYPIYIWERRTSTRHRRSRESKYHPPSSRVSASAPVDTMHEIPVPAHPQAKSMPRRPNVSILNTCRTLPAHSTVNSRAVASDQDFGSSSLRPHELKPSTEKLYHLLTVPRPQNKQRQQSPGSTRPIRPDPRWQQNWSTSQLEWGRNPGTSSALRPRTFAHPTTTSSRLRPVTHQVSTPISSSTRYMTEETRPPAYWPTEKTLSTGPTHGYSHRVTTPTYGCSHAKRSLWIRHQRRGEPSSTRKDSMPPVYNYYGWCSAHVSTTLVLLQVPWRNPVDAAQQDRPHMDRYKFVLLWSIHAHGNSTEPRNECSEIVVHTCSGIVRYGGDRVYKNPDTRHNSVEPGEDETKSPQPCGLSTPPIQSKSTIRPTYTFSTHSDNKTTPQPAKQAGWRSPIKRTSLRQAGATPEDQNRDISYNHAHWRVPTPRLLLSPLGSTLRPTPMSMAAAPTKLQGSPASLLLQPSTSLQQRSSIPGIAWDYNRENVNLIRTHRRRLCLLQDSKKSQDNHNATRPDVGMGGVP